MRTLRIFTLLFVLPCLFSGCTKQLTEEERVREVVEQAAQAARAKDVKGFMRLVSPDYYDDAGNNYDGVKGMLLYRLMRGGSISIFLRNMAVEVKENKALVDVDAVIVLGREVETLKDLAPEDIAGYRFSVVFRKEEDGWKAISAKWADVGLAVLL